MNRPLWLCPFKIQKEKRVGLQLTSMYRTSLVLTPLRIHWTVPLKKCSNDSIYVLIFIHSIMYFPMSSNWRVLFFNVSSVYICENKAYYFWGFRGLVVWCWVLFDTFLFEVQSFKVQILEVQFLEVQSFGFSLSRISRSMLSLLRFSFSRFSLSRFGRWIIVLHTVISWTLRMHPKYQCLTNRGQRAPGASPQVEELLAALSAPSTNRCLYEYLCVQCRI